MNEETINHNNDNNHLNTNSSINLIKINSNFFESEIVSKYILEKIISLVLSTIFKKEVEKKLVDVCYIDLKNILDDIKDLEFIKHDKDDLIKKKILLDKIPKTPKKQNKKFSNFLKPKEKENLLNKNKSQIIKGYKLINDLDPDVSINYSINIKPLLPIEKQVFYDLNNEKKVMKILKKKNMNEIKSEFIQKSSVDIDEPFNEQLQKIEKIESYKIENLSLLNKNKKNKNIIISSDIKESNNWNIIVQPNHSIIDRDASTQLKIDNTFKNYFEENNSTKNNDKLEIKINNNSNKSDKFKIGDKKRIFKLRKFTFIKKEEPPKKIKRIVIPDDLPSYDLEPEKSNRIEETDDIKQMRKIVENDIYKRHLEELKEQQQKERQNYNNNLFNQKKGFFNPNITVDVKGNLVVIKPIKIDSLIREFKNMESHPKDVGRIQDKTFVEKSFKNVKVEVNKNSDNILNPREKSAKKANNSSRTSNSKADGKSKNQSKIEKNKEINKTPNRTGLKFASGSNFEIMNLECGVNLIENKKKKTGGKDYFQKYGRCSFEIFQDQLNKTNSFYQQGNLNIININASDSEDYIKTEISLPPVKAKKLKREKTDYEIKISEPNFGNNMLNSKTKNLKAALSNLDLINEKKFNEFTKTNYENKNWDILKNNNMKGGEKEKINLGEINIFNKSLMKNKLWGDPNESQSPYMTRKYPIKPEKFLQREKSQDKLNNSPRKRLPPINSAIKLYNLQVSQTQNGGFHLIKNKNNFKEIKNINLSKDSLYGNKNKNFLSEANHSFHNTDGN